MKIFLSTILAFLLMISVANAAYIIEGTLSTDGSIPKAPEDVLVEKTNDTTIFIDWDPVAGVEGYNIYRKKNSEDFVLVTDVDVTISSYTDSGLGDGTYSYQIQPFLGSLEPELSGILPAGPVTISIPTPTPTPTPSGGGGGGTPASTPASPLSEAAQAVDTNGDNKIDIMDFNSLVVNWGSTAAGNIADFDNNGTVDVFDFNLLMTYWTG